MDGRFFERVYGLVRQIPSGQVATYGQLALYLDYPHGARTVGWAMRGCPADVPWHRVINARGRISAHGRPPDEVVLQQALLEAEGIVFGPDGQIDLRTYRWAGPAWSME